MATTSATKKQAAAIKQRMQEIRSELPYNVDDARRRVRQLSDWKYHLCRHPIPFLVAAAVAGYLLVPAKKSQTVVVQREGQGMSEPTKRGLISGIVGAAATMAVRQAMTQATTHATSWLKDQRHRAASHEQQTHSAHSESTL